jgi:hypothetical protein
MYGITEGKRSLRRWWDENSKTDLNEICFKEIETERVGSGSDRSDFFSEDRGFQF